MRRATPLLVLALLLAGCTGPATVPQPAGAASWDAVEHDIGTPIVPDHTHADGSLHLHHVNLDLVARVTGHEPDPAPDGESYAETAVKDGFAYLTRYGPESGLVIFDVRDLEHPKKVGELRIDAGFEPDIEVSDDGNWAFWETQRFPVSTETPSPDPGANVPHGVDILDIRDKANPKWAGFYPVTPDGPHSITYANIGGRDIVFLSVYAFAYAYANLEVPRQQRLVITELDTSVPGFATLKELATYAEPGASGKPGLFPHDVSVQVHPLTHRALAYVGYWDVGMVILDVTDPARPQHVSTFTDFGPASYGKVHMARAFPELIDGKHVTMVEPEVGGAKDTGYLTFVDTTDPAAPAYLSSWLLPGNLTSQGLRFSPHYFDLLQGRVCMASYHAGVWVVDVHDAANLQHPRSAGFAETGGNRTSSGLPAVGLFGGEASAFDAWWVDATHCVVGDSVNGLAVYRYAGPAPDAR
ncbi:MAG: hypothetical protein LC624_04880 [Halobacteriales archaeon]|nr:hypothetical protein [Halobacteriales archaeon]